jgi:hypothetical protein
LSTLSITTFWIPPIFGPLRTTTPPMFFSCKYEEDQGILGLIDVQMGNELQETRVSWEMQVIKTSGIMAWLLGLDDYSGIITVLVPSFLPLGLFYTISIWLRPFFYGFKELLS